MNSNIDLEQVYQWAEAVKETALNPDTRDTVTREEIGLSALALGIKKNIKFLIKEDEANRSIEELYEKFSEVME